MKNDRIITTAMKLTQFDLITPRLTQQGRHTPPNKINREPIQSHISSYNPSISHYRREHAPKRLYLPSELTVNMMYKDYKEKHQDNPCSYKTYRKEVTDMNISFAKLGEEECSTCLGYQRQQHPNHDTIPKPTHSECPVCESWKTHLQKAKDARDRYKVDSDNASKIPDPYRVVRSIDLQKVIMLPRIPGHKSV
ncbi:hypothetical protein JTE90_001856 [Oedothorax gibbosus]|uniref:Uncharacterized protein n=1 Tax=Oedothorax gibbosus TaxID=931172 RepID=A0AAV6VQI1_9ARAC|nr:hypothetical protein JTE90_001856 [Oedothorax gibbosus]